MEVQDVSGPGLGIFPKDTYCMAFIRTGATAAIGDLFMFDMTSGDATGAISLQLGNENCPLAEVVLPATIGIGGLSGAAATTRAGYFFGIVVDLLGGAGADNSKVKLQLQGVVKKASLTSAAVTPGVSLYAADGVKTLASTTAAGNKVLGYGWEANGSAAGLFQIIFDGINGFGAPAAS